MLRLRPPILCFRSVGKLSMQHDPDSRSWGGQSVFDVYTQAQGTALGMTNYAD